MKAILLKGLEMPQGEETFLDVRINSDGTVLIPCGTGECDTVRAEQIEVEA